MEVNSRSTKLRGNLAVKSNSRNTNMSEICKSGKFRNVQIPMKIKISSENSAQFIYLLNNYIIERNLEIKFPTIWTNEQQSRAEAEGRERLEERKSEKRKSQKKEDTDAKR